MSGEPADSKGEATLAAELRRDTRTPHTAAQRDAAHPPGPSAAAAAAAAHRLPPAARAALPAAVVILFKQTGDAPILKQNKVKVRLGAAAAPSTLLCLH